MPRYNFAHIPGENMIEPPPPGEEYAWEPPSMEPEVVRYPVPEGEFDPWKQEQEKSRENDFSLEPPPGEEYAVEIPPMKSDVIRQPVPAEQKTITPLPEMETDPCYSTIPILSNDGYSY